MNSKQIEAALRGRNQLRQACRTDLSFLCKVIGYPDVSWKVHGPILNVLQKFPGGEDTENKKTGAWTYKPAKEIWQLPGRHEKLILYPRGHLKTSVVSQAHAIQWIINFPDIRILLSCATGDQVEKVIRAVKGVFQYNDAFRAVFPDFCPPREKASDFGSKDQFIVPARRTPKGEPTMFAVTVGKTIAGYHPDVIFHSDLVDKENVKTPGGIRDVIEHFQYMAPLLERYSARDGYPASRGFTFVEGTTYDFGDLHNVLMKNPDWEMVMRPAADPYPPRSPADILWPERFPAEELERLRRDMGDWMFSSQYLLKCVAQGDGLCEPKEIKFLSHDIVRQLLPRLRLQCVIDLAGMEKTRDGDDTVLTVAGFDRDGRAIVPEIHCGQFAPEDVINLMFDIKRRYPTLICFKIEKDAHARVLLPFLQRQMSKKNVYFSIIEVKRDTHTSKQQRIRGLRPWLKNGLITFSDGIGLTTKQKLLDQVAQFPSQSSGVHDDILDTLADAMQDGEGGVTMDVVADPPDMKFGQFGVQRPPDKFLGFGEAGVSRWLYGEDGQRDVRSMTGLL